MYSFFLYYFSTFFAHSKFDAKYPLQKGFYSDASGVKFTGKADFESKLHYGNKLHFNRHNGKTCTNICTFEMFNKKIGPLGILHSHCAQQGLLTLRYKTCLYFSRCTKQTHCGFELALFTTDYETSPTPASHGSQRILFL